MRSLEMPHETAHRLVDLQVPDAQRPVEAAERGPTVVGVKGRGGDLFRQQERFASTFAGRDLAQDGLVVKVARQKQLAPGIECHGGHLFVVSECLQELTGVQIQQECRSQLLLEFAT